MMMKTIDILVSNREKLGHRCRVFNITDIVVFMQCLKWCVVNGDDVIGILTNILDHKHVKGLKSMAKYHNFSVNLTIVDPQDLPISLTQHILHDKHRFIGTSTDTPHVVIDDKRVRIEELPTLLLSDPVCMWYGYRNGYIVECTDIKPGSKRIQVVKHDTYIRTL